MPKTVLIVDDDEDIRRMVRDALLGAGYRVFAAASASEAITCLCSSKPDLILLDLSLPDLEGHYVASRVAANCEWFEIPVIILSGRSDPTNRSLARLFGASDYITKPFDVQDLLDRVQNALSQTVEP